MTDSAGLHKQRQLDHASGIQLRELHLHSARHAQAIPKLPCSTCSSSCPPFTSIMNGDSLQPMHRIQPLHYLSFPRRSSSSSFEDEHILYLGLFVARPDTNHRSEVGCVGETTIPFNTHEVAGYHHGEG